MTNSANSKRQKGAAIITAMLVVALAATIVSTLYARQNVAIRSIENRLNLSQARWIERAATDWAKVILRADKRTAGAVDHRAETWAVKVDQTKVDETVTAGGKLDSVQARATLAGAMEDAQGFFNLANLQKDGKLDEVELDTLRRLMQFLSVSPQLADAIAQAILDKLPRDKEGKPVVSAVVSDQLPFKRPADLIAVAGVDQYTIRLLADHVVILPKRTAINVNTATPEVLASALSAINPTNQAGVVTNFDLPRARAISEMAVNAPFTNLEDFRRRAGIDAPLASGRFDVKTGYFLMKGVVRYDRIVSRTATLFDRTGNLTEVVWQDRY
jgi:general secretion pathway protein K